MLQLILHADDRPPFGKADAEKFGKLRDHIGGIVVPLRFYHPGNGIQRIVEEMGIDLALQGIQLASPSLILFPDDLLHQALYPLIGSLDGISQVPDLLRAADIDFRLLSRFVLLTESFNKRIGLEILTAITRLIITSIIPSKASKEDKITDIDHPMGKGRIWDDTHQLPSRITDRIDKNLSLLSLKGLVIDTVLVGRRSLTVLT